VIFCATLSLSRERRNERRQEWFSELATEFDDRRLTGLVWTIKLAPVCAWERSTSIHPMNVAAGMIITGSFALVQSFADLALAKVVFVTDPVLGLNPPCTSWEFDAVVWGLFGVSLILATIVARYLMCSLQKQLK
jgi:hypothetical protein